KPARVRQHGSVPAGPAMEAPGLLNGPMPWAQVEVIGVSQNHLGIYLPQVLKGQGFNRGVGSYGHKNRGFNHPMGGHKGSGPGAAVCSFQGILKHGTLSWAIAA